MSMKMIIPNVIFNLCLLFIVVIDAHLSKICYLVWNEETKVMISCSEDKTVKMLQMPLQWPAEYMRSNKGINQQKAFDIERDVIKQNNLPLPMASSFSNIDHRNIESISNSQTQVKRNPFFVERSNNSGRNTNEYFSSSTSATNKDNTDYTNIAAKFTGNIDLRSSIENESIIPKFTQFNKQREGEEQNIFSKRPQITAREKWSEDLDGWAL